VLPLDRAAITHVTAWNAHFQGQVWSAASICHRSLPV